MKSLAELIDSLPTYERNVDKRQSEIADNEVARYQCYCCYDKGEIVPHLARLIIPDYQDGDIVACVRTSNCRKGWHTMADGVQNNISVSTCETLHQINLNQWKSYSEFQAQKNKAIIDEFASSI